MIKQRCQGALIAMTTASVNYWGRKMPLWGGNRGRTLLQREVYWEVHWSPHSRWDKFGHFHLFVSYELVNIICVSYTVGLCLERSRLPLLGCSSSTNRWCGAAEERQGTESVSAVLSGKPICGSAQRGMLMLLFCIFKEYPYCPERILLFHVCGYYRVPLQVHYVFPLQYVITNYFLKWCCGKSCNVFSASSAL